MGSWISRDMERELIGTLDDTILNEASDIGRFFSSSPISIASTLFESEEFSLNFLHIPLGNCHPSIILNIEIFQAFYANEKNKFSEIFSSLPFLIECQAFVFIFSFFDEK
jgi:hypothetical protein